MLSTISDQLFVLLVRNLGCYWNAHIPMQGYIIFYGTRGTLIWQRSWASQQDHSHPLENIWKISVQVVLEVYVLEKATLKVLELTRRENFWLPPSSRTMSLAYYLTYYSLPQSHLWEVVFHSKCWNQHLFHIASDTQTVKASEMIRHLPMRGGSVIPRTCFRTLFWC